MSAYHMQNFYHILATKILYTFLIIHTYALCSTYLTLLDLICLNMIRWKESSGSTA